MSSSQPLKGFMNWASVASWFLKPETTCLLTNMANSDKLSSTVCAISTASPIRTLSEEAKNETASKNKEEKTLQAPTIATAIKCTIPKCKCECFIPGTEQLRYCETCKHGWVPHGIPTKERPSRVIYLLQETFGETRKYSRYPRGQGMTKVPLFYRTPHTLLCQSGDNLFQGNPLNLAKYQESVEAQDKFSGEWNRLAINQEQVVVPEECAQKLGEAAVLSPLDPEID
ncbi:hypothetical protein HHI36_022824 [Cryptolaemus montrouzieri]|uniref:Uncharacterized protein n=1 Tax=Cryptolaemus montrouzieri TaxID=559131 RepID=A0ABD2PEQ1_9CUCU